jgi:hypothetical protein
VAGTCDLSTPKDGRSHFRDIGVIKNGPIAGRRLFFGKHVMIVFFTDTPGSWLFAGGFLACGSGVHFATFRFDPVATHG